VDSKKENVIDKVIFTIPKLGWVSVYIKTAFALMNNSYACSNKRQRCDVIFTHVNSYDNEVQKDVGNNLK